MSADCECCGHTEKYRKFTVSNEVYKMILKNGYYLAEWWENK